MQIWQCANIFALIWKSYVEDFTLKQLYFLRYTRVKYVKGLFTNIQKQMNMLKISLLFKKFANFTGQTTRKFLELSLRNFQGIIFIWTQTYWEIFYCISIPLNWESSVCRSQIFRKASQEIRSRTCDFINKTLQHRCCSVTIAIFLRTTFSQNTSRWLLLECHIIQNYDIRFSFSRSSFPWFKPHTLMLQPFISRLQWYSRSFLWSSC